MIDNKTQENYKKELNLKEKINLKNHNINRRWN